MNQPHCMEGVFLRNLFESFNKSGLSYCVLRNYETLPNSFGGSDLDLAVIPREKEAFAELIFEVVARHGGRVICDYVSSGRFIRVLGQKNGVWWGAAIDLFWMMEYRGVEYIQSKKVIERAVDYRGLKVACDDDGAVIALLKELLSNGKTRKNYFYELAELYRQHGEVIFKLMRLRFSQETIARLGVALEKNEQNGSRMEGLVTMLRRDVLCCGIGNQLDGMLRNLKLRLRRLIKPAGISVAITGTDGAGKSTLIKAISPALEQALHSPVHYEHLRPNWLDALGVAAGKRKKSDGAPVTDPHGQPPSGFLGSLLRLGYYWLDYTLGYWKKIYPRLVKRPHLTVFDRYFYDILIDPCRMRIQLPLWIMRVMFHFVPKPDLVVCLGADPKILFTRKPETTLDEVTRQIADLKQLAMITKNAIWVDTGGGLDHSKDTVLRAISIVMSNRY